VDLGIAGRRAAVAASSRGLGYAIAAALAAEGVRIALCGRDSARVEAAARSIGDAAVPLVADVSSLDGARGFVVDARRALGGVDILVANAGGPPPARALEVTDEGMLSAVNANMLTSIRLVEASVPHLRARGWGRIVLVASWGVKQPIPTLAYSNAARAGLWAWAKTAAGDLVDDGVTLNLLCPGTHATDRMRELGFSGPAGDPEDFGRIAAFLCSAHTSYLSGAAIQVDGAGTLGLL
jgi:3-oxoacyl-[acyl-carrier protein] reductase